MWTLLGAKGRGFPQHFEPLCFFVGTFIIIINYVIYLYWVFFFSNVVYNCIDVIVHGQVCCVCSFICLSLDNIIFSKYTMYILIHHQVVLICCFTANPVLFHCFVVVPFFCQWGLFCFVFCFCFFLFPFLKSITMLSTLVCSISNTILL